MSTLAPTPRLYFDFVDPLSFLLEREVSAAESTLDVVVARVGVEVNPPPRPLSDPGDSVWTDRWAQASALAKELEIELEEPRLVPWSRKAHELLLHAESAGSGAEVRRAIFHAFFLEGRDIGRVDVLVGLAREAGLDTTESKAVLDVDRYSAEVSERRDAAVASGVDTVPLVVSGARSLEGFHNRASLSTFLRGSS